MATAATGLGGTRAWRIVRWSLGCLALLYLLLGLAIARAAQPQQLWACPDPAPPRGETLYSEPPVAGCKPTVTTEDRVEAFALDTFLGPAMLVIKTLYGDD